ncbi:MAG: TIR domain-containing protein [Clostridia bacterium]|nr:TIR domain-containing protein [Clostridia bacterium]
MTVFKCKMCGGTIEFEQGATVGVCDSCGTKQTLPRLDDDRRANLYDRANHFRRANEFDKAAGIYEQILNEDKTDAEAYWSLVLCRYGIEYVEDPATRKRVPTVNRAQYTSVFDDDNYKSALQYADGYQRSLYEEEANTINEIQKGILAISQNEEPFDVFICYKETDQNGRRTPDSVLANDLYHQLTNEGFKVFFSRITLEDKLGTAYEPYIFAALNSSRVMVVLGTKAEYFNAVWVKNEWSRYLALVKQSGGKKILIPAYRDMDPYDLPEEFSHLQAQDMSKLGFMQDLMRGIRKIAQADEPKPAAKETVVVNQTAAGNTAPLLKRAFMYLEDGNWGEADAYCERVLDQDPENAEAYLGKLMAELKLRKEADFEGLISAFDRSTNYQKAIRFGDKAIVEKLKTWNSNAPKEGIYQSAKKELKNARNAVSYKAVSQSFARIQGYKDADALREKALSLAEDSIKDDIYKKAIKAMIDGADAKDRASLSSNYDSRIKQYETAKSLFKQVPGWRDADEKVAVCEKAIDDLHTEQKRTEEEEKEARLAKEKRKKKARKIAAIVIPAVAVLTAIAILLPTVIIPAIKYNSAVQLLKEGKYEEAITAFQLLNGYKDSAARIDESKNESAYHHALGLMNEGQYEEAKKEFISLHGYRDSKVKIEECDNALCDNSYQKALSEAEAGRKKEAIKLLQGIEQYKDASELIIQYKYDMALELFENGKYELAIDAFSDLSGYSDSKDKIKECQQLLDDKQLEDEYNRAVLHLQNQEYVEAIKAFKALNGYKDSEERIERIRTDMFKKASVGSSLFLGSYEQDNIRNNGKEEIEWQILDIKGDKALLISKYALDFRPYNEERKDVTWETCTLRKWLNDGFISDAFSDSEKKLLLNTTISADKNSKYKDVSPGKTTTDKVFLLSIREAEEYFPNSTNRMCPITAYALSRQQKILNITADNIGIINEYWWLRTPGLYSSYASFVSSNGEILYNGVEVNGGGTVNFGSYYMSDVNPVVRPAMWIDLGAAG